VASNNRSASLPGLSKAAAVGEPFDELEARYQMLDVRYGLKT